MNDLDRYAVSLENMEVLRAQVEAQAREIETLKSAVLVSQRSAVSIATELRAELAALKAQPSGVVLPVRADSVAAASGYHKGWNACLDEVARLNPSRGVQEGFGITQEQIDRHTTTAWECPPQSLVVLVSSLKRLAEKNATSPSAPSHSEQVREGWQLVPVEPTDAMLEAGDKYIGTPATYKSMLSACPSPAITKDFSQFLSAVMDAAGLIRHGRQSKELSEYLGMKCMEYRGAAPSAGSQGGDV